MTGSGGSCVFTCHCVRHLSHHFKTTARHFNHCYQPFLPLQRWPQFRPDRSGGGGGGGGGGGIKRDPDRQGEALHVGKADFSQTSCSSQVFLYDAG